MIDFSRRALLAAILGFGTIAPRTTSLAADNTSAGEMRVALCGYDPVAYFSLGQPEQGSAEFSAAFDDAVYWFANADHQAMFAAEPDRYAPQYGGHCAIGVSRGRVLEPDPEAWAIADGKLYVFHTKSGVPLFDQQTAAIIEQATTNWPGLTPRR